MSARFPVSQRDTAYQPRATLWVGVGAERRNERRKVPPFGYCLSLSRITGSHGRSCSSTGIAKVLACWLVQSAVGCAVQGETQIRRVPMGMKTGKPLIDRGHVATMRT
jgi:hypothetical protein